MIFKEFNQALQQNFEEMSRDAACAYAQVRRELE